MQEEREKRLEAMFDAGVEDSRDGLSKEDVPDEGSVGVAGKKTQDSIAAVDSIIEALEMAESEAARLTVHKVNMLCTNTIISHYLRTKSLKTRTESTFRSIALKIESQPSIYYYSTLNVF